jgi:hypothetical protein
VGGINNIAEGGKHVGGNLGWEIFLYQQGGRKRGRPKNSTSAVRTVVGGINNIAEGGKHVGKNLEWEIFIPTRGKEEGEAEK